MTLLYTQVKAPTLPLLRPHVTITDGIWPFLRVVGVHTNDLDYHRFPSVDLSVHDQIKELIDPPTFQSFRSKDDHK